MTSKTTHQNSTHNYLTFFPFVHLALGQDLPVVRPEEVGLSGKRLERIDEAFAGYVKDNKMAGSVILVSRKGKVAHITRRLGTGTSKPNLLCPRMRSSGSHPQNKSHHQCRDNDFAGRGQVVDPGSTW